MAANPYEEFQKPAAATATADPYAEFQKPAVTTAPAPESHPVSDFASNFGAAINPFPGLKQAITHPIDTAKGAVNAQLDQFKQARQDFSNTKEMPNLSDRLMSAGGHTLAGLVPLVGPAAAHAGEQIGSGDIAGGIGTGVGIALPFMLGAAGVGPNAMARGLGKAIKAPAGPIAETALGVRKLDRAYGRTPGQAILEETGGVRPSTVAASAQSKLGNLNSDLDTMVNASNQPASLTPARTILDDATTKAFQQNAKTAANQINPMRAHLDQNFATGAKIPANVTPRELLNLKRGFGDEFIHNWNPETMAGTKGTASKAYHALDSELDRTVPGSDQLNQRISSLIPVAKRAASTDLNENALQKVLGRVARPTGALVSGATGAMEGARHFGPLGGISGAAIGLGLPELIASPTAQMIAARGLQGTGKALTSPVGSQIAGRTAQSGALLSSKRREQK